MLSSTILTLTLLVGIGVSLGAVIPDPSFQDILKLTDEQPNKVFNRQQRAADGHGHGYHHGGYGHHGGHGYGHHGYGSGYHGGYYPGGYGHHHHHSPYYGTYPIHGYGLGYGFPRPGIYLGL